MNAIYKLDNSDRIYDLKGRGEIKNPEKLSFQGEIQKSFIVTSHNQIRSHGTLTKVEGSKTNRIYERRLSVWQLITINRHLITCSIQQLYGTQFGALLCNERLIPCANFDVFSLRTFIIE